MADNNEYSRLTANRELQALSRRQLITAIGSGTAVGLAGCSGDGGDGDSGDDGEPSPADGDDDGDGGTPTEQGTPTDTPGPPGTAITEAKDPTLDVMIETVPTDLNMREWNFNTARSWISSFSGGWLAVNSDDAEKDGLNPIDFPGLIEQTHLSDDGSQFTVKYSEDYTWTNGDPVTARDKFVPMEWSRLKAVQLNREPTFQNIEQLDDYTLRYTFTTPRRIFRKGKPLQGPRYYRGQTEPWLEKMQDAGGPRETYLLTQDLNQKETPITEMDKIVSNGMYELDSVTDQELLLTKFDGHPHAAKQNIERIRFTLAKGQSARRLRVQNNEVDYTSSVPANTDLPNSFKQSGALTSSGMGFRFDFTNRHGANRKFRQAMAFLLSPDNMVDAAADSRVVETQQVGMHRLGYEDHLSDSFKDKLIQYGTGAKPQKAVSRMQSAGYERNNDRQWVGPDGNKVSLQVKTTDHDPGSRETALDAMNSFGFETTVETGGTSSLWGLSDTKNWDMEFSLFLGGPTGFPTTFFRKISWWYRMVPSWKHVGEGDGNVGDNNSFKKAKEGDEDVTGFANRPLTAEVPTTVGELDPGGDTKTIEWSDHVSRLKSPETSDEEWQQALEDMAWRANYLADPIIPYSFVMGSYHDDDNFAFPDIGRNDIGVAVGLNSPQQYNINKGIAYGRQK